MKKLILVLAGNFLNHPVTCGVPLHRGKFFVLHHAYPKETG